MTLKITVATYDEMLDSVMSRLEAVFQKVFDDSEIRLTAETTAADIEDWDSLAHIHLILAVEKEFKVKFSTPEIVGLQNVGDFASLLEKKIVKA